MRTILKFLSSPLGCLVFYSCYSCYSWFPLFADEPPVRNRPPRFSGAVGVFAIKATATPTELHVEQPLTLTLHITAVTPPRQPPRRPDLRDLPGFKDSFYLEALPEPESSRHPDDRTWEFRYRLKPRTTAVEGVPGIPFVFYKPSPSPSARGSFQTLYSNRVPLTVKPAEAADSVLPDALPPAPASALRVVEGPAVLRQPGDWDLALVWAGASVLVGAPAGCAAWYLCWRRLRPDEGRRRQQLRSQAARHALGTLTGLDRHPAAEQPALAVRILTAYLRQRADLPATDPTPEAAAAHLRRAGFMGSTAEAVARFLRDSDEARFAPVGPDKRDEWRARTTDLILSLETESWSAWLS
jgi:hypothetical protein